MSKEPDRDGLHYQDLSIKGFRGFRDVSIPRLGRVTLITGKNNTGKSSILEALRIHADNAELSTLQNILAFREEAMAWDDEEVRVSDPETLLHVSALFHGFPQLSEEFEPIRISSSNGPLPMWVRMNIEWFAEERDGEGRRRLTANQLSLFGEPEGIPALVVETEEGKSTHRLDSSPRYLRPPRLPRLTRLGKGTPCVSVSPYGGEGTRTLGALWDGIALTDSERDVVKALQLIDEDISAVSMVGGEHPRRLRTAIVRAGNIPRPVPLRSFGDGMNRLFGIVLSLVNARGGILLVDEFENGLHYTIQLDAWRLIFRLARTLDVQVFATSHSWDAIETFQKAASEAPEEGALVRLIRNGEDIAATVFTEGELAIATRDRIEVR